MSFCEPNVKPSYHCFTCSFLSGNPNLSSDENTLSSVKPKLVLYSSDVVVTTLRLLRSENIDSFETRVMPVITALSRYGFVLNVLLNILRKNEVNSSQYPCIYASCIGVSYSSRSIITFFP